MAQQDPGRRGSEPALTAATRGLVTQIFTRGFRVLRLSQVLGWADLTLAGVYAAPGITVLATLHPEVKWALGILALINSGAFLITGISRALVWPRKLRRNAERALQLSADGT